ncbi:MAG: VapE family protein [Bacteroidales bacterium]|nr:VapE family protein [Bacteroidales bacterium]
MTKVSIFKNFNVVAGIKEIETIAEVIRNGQFESEVSKLQKLLNAGNQKEYSKQKKSLLAFTPSALYQGGRKTEFLQEYTRIIILDLDKLGAKINELKQKAVSCKYTYCCFISPSGQGLKILVRTNSSMSKHKEAFIKIQNYYEEQLNIKIDPSGKDISRLCFFSYDENLYLNKKSETFKIKVPMNIENDIEKLISIIEEKRIDITNDYDTWLKIGFSIESEFGESGRSYYHSVSQFSENYNYEKCNEQYDKCVKNNSSGITIKTLFHYAKQQGITLRSNDNRNNTSDQDSKKITSNKFVITEEYLNQRYDVRYNVISNKFEYRDKGEVKFREMNENNMFIQLQKDNINISLNHLIALLKSDFVKEYDVFRDYFESLPNWDGETDYIGKLASYLQSQDSKRLSHHFKKWLVRAVRNSIDQNYFNKQCFVLVSTKQNSGKSTFCRFLCPPELENYIVESIGTDKDSHIAITENFLINLDELSQAEKAEINAFKSMFSKDKVKARLTYDKRPSVHARRANFMGSTDRWEFLTDENGSVRWLCFEIDSIDWNYKKDIEIDDVWAQAYHLLTNTKYFYDLTIEEIKENDYINKKYQVSSPERDLIQKFFKPGDETSGLFMSSTDMIEYISQYSSIRINPVQVGRELKFLGFTRKAKFINGNAKYGYIVEGIYKKE